MKLKTLNLVSLLIMPVILLISINGYGQSFSADCPDCSIEQSKYDSINTVYSKSKVQLKEAEDQYKELLAESNADNEDNKKNITESKINFDKIKSKHLKLKQSYQTIVSDLENCLATANPGECAECEDGKLLFKDGAPCDDGDPCTKNDRCVNGVCIGDPVTSNENPECAGGK